MGEPAVLHPQLRKLIGTVIDDRYTVDEVIGAGGMGVVFRGRQLMLRRDVAIKVMNPDLSHEMTSRFTREAESAARLDHPNCITVYEFGTYSSGLHYMVMPLLEGKRLTQLVQSEAIAARRAVDWGVQILRGLEHAHCRGVIHRDVKPDNIVVVRHEDGTELLKVVDFGLAKIISTEQQWADSTMSGLMSGTPAYMSPEQALGLPTDTRSDIYSAGFILYRMLTGSLPFEDEDPIAQMRRHITDEVPALPESIPRPLARVIERMVRKERNQRYASVAEALSDLEAIRKGAHYLPGDSVASPPAFASLSSEPIDLTAGDPGDNSDFIERPVPERLSPTVPAMAALSPRRNRFPLLVGTGACLGVVAVGIWWLVGITSRAQAVETAQADLTAASAITESGSSAASRSPASPSRATPAAPDLGSDMLELLGKVNERDPTHVLDYRERHAMLDRLAGSPTAAKLVDAHVNLGFDLVQSGQSPTPCTTFAATLDAIAASKDADFVPALQRARAPDPLSVSGAGKAPDGACEGLEERRAALLAQLAGTKGTSSPASSSKRKQADRRGAKGSGQSGKSDNTTKPTKPTGKPGAERPANPWENGQIDEVKNPFGG